MFIEYLRNIIRYQPNPRKVEPTHPIDQEYPLEKQDEPVVIVEIAEVEEEKKLPKVHYDTPKRKHKLSIWV